MQGPVILTLSGAGTVFAKVPTLAAQVVAILPRPDGSAALDVKLYSSPGGALVEGSLPAGSALLGEFTGPAASAGIPLSLAPDGVGVTGYLAAVFADSGAAHALYAFLK